MILRTPLGSHLSTEDPSHDTKFSGFLQVISRQQGSDRAHCTNGCHARPFCKKRWVSFSGKEPLFLLCQTVSDRKLLALWSKRTMKKFDCGSYFSPHMCHMEPPSTEAAGRIIQLWQVSSISVSNEALSRTLPMQRLHCHDPHAQKPHNSGTSKIGSLIQKTSPGWPPKKFQQNMESNSLFAAAFPNFRDRKKKKTSASTQHLAMLQALGGPVRIFCSEP